MSFFFYIILIPIIFSYLGSLSFMSLIPRKAGKVLIGTGAVIGSRIAYYFTFVSIIPFDEYFALDDFGGAYAMVLIVLFWLVVLQGFGLFNLIIAPKDTSKKILISKYLRGAIFSDGLILAWILLSGIFPT